MTDEQLEKQTGEGFEEWIYKYPDKCDIREFEKPNHNYYVSKESWQASRLPLMKKIDEMEKEMQSMADSFNFESSTNAQEVSELQKENEELRESLKQMCYCVKIFAKELRGKDADEIILKFNLDKN